VYLIGSYAQNNAHSKSDIDFLIISGDKTFPNMSGPGLFKKNFFTIRCFQ
jgi:predicted nucleotidyltransferase